MVKNIKKSLKYIIIIIGVIILLPTVLFNVLQISEVQTYIVNRITSHFSYEIKSTISVGKIEYKFFNKLLINDILIKDKNNDTLIYSERITAGVRRLDIKNKIIRLGKVVLVNPKVALITDSAGLMNLTWYLNLIKNPADTVSKPDFLFMIDEIDLSNARFSLINNSTAKGKAKIDFNRLHLKDINGIIEEFKIQNDTTSFNVYNLTCKESSGFTVTKMSSSVILSRQKILFSSTFLNSDSSIINISRLGLVADSLNSFRRFNNEVKLDIRLDRSLINTSDMEYFLPSANVVNESVWLSGKIFGTISELRGRNIELSYGTKTYLDCDFDLSGLPKVENTFIYIGVNNLKTNTSDIENINLKDNKHLKVPAIISKLGNISFDGSFTGFTTDFVAYGKIRTSIGNIRTDLSLRPEESDNYRIKGLLTGSNIALGELLGKEEFIGKLSIQTNIDGYASSFKKFAINLTGIVDSVEINNYKYRNIDLNGIFTEKTWDGSVNISDENIKLDLLGLLNFSEELPEFDFTLNIADANLYKLNFDKLDPTSTVTVLLTSNFKGNSIDNLDGEIKLLNSTFKKYNKNLELYDFSIRTYTDNYKPVLSLRTDFVDADITGKYNFADINNLIRSTLAVLMPSKYTYISKQAVSKSNRFSFAINFKNTDKINNFFKTGLLLAEKSFVRGDIYPDSLLSINGKATSLTIKNNLFKDFSFDANITGNELNAGIKSSSLKLLRQSELKDFSVDLKTKPDNFIFIVDWDDNDKNKIYGNFIARGEITKSSLPKGNSILTIHIDSTEVNTRNNLWKITQSSIIIDSNAIDINKLQIINKDNYYMINGSASEDAGDTLHLEFKGIDISPLNYLLTPKSTSEQTSIPLDFKGTLNGKILLTNVYKNLLLEGNINVRNFSLLGSEYGTMSISSVLDLTKRVVNITASNNLEGVKMIDIYGFYDPALKKTDLTANAARLPIGALNPLLKVFASGISGYASGKVNLSGISNNLILKGAVLAENASMKINYLQTKYKLNDTIRFDKNGFKFNNIKLTDEKGNTATLSGSVNHKNFHDYRADLIINTNECLVLNTKPKDNELFYGTAYATGVTTIKTGPNSLSFDISAKTGKNTKFFIPLNTGLSISENSFITFVDSKTAKEKNKNDNKLITTANPAKQTGMDLNFDLEVTPDAEVQLIFDSKAGDVMKGRGSGNLNISLDKKGDFRISGDYIIDEGDYLFTLGNILNKPFSVENGGKIVFNGDLNDADIDIKAIYKLKASLYEILQDESYKERIPVECQLNLTGKLFNPIVGFNIYLPTADEQTRTYLRNAISTEEELSRQFLYLLVMNSFYADPSFGPSSTSNTSTTTGTSAMAVTTTEMLSNQLSNWLSQISNDFDIGFVYRPGYNAINPQEVQVALSTQLLNDKVIINGNFDVRGTGNTTENTDQITGDFDAEVKITEKIRFKVFNRFNNPYTGRGVPYTQGIGIFFKQDFDRLSDLFHKKLQKEAKKEEEPSLKEN